MEEEIMIDNIDIKVNILFDNTLRAYLNLAVDKYRTIHLTLPQKGSVVITDRAEIEKFKNFLLSYSDCRKGYLGYRKEVRINGHIKRCLLFIWQFNDWMIDFIYDGERVFIGDNMRTCFKIGMDDIMWLFTKKKGVYKTCQEIKKKKKFLFFGQKLITV